jgi:hypothetical protein
MAVSSTKFPPAYQDFSLVLQQCKEAPLKREELEERVSGFQQYLSEFNAKDHSCQIVYLARSLQEKSTKFLVALDKADESAKRLQALTKRLATFEAAIESNEDKKSPAELIFPTLKSKIVRDILRTKTLGVNYLRQQLHLSKTLAAIDNFLRRVHTGVYGIKAKAIILNPASSPLYNAETFTKLLLVDLLSQKKITPNSVELFPEMTEEQLDSLRKKKLTLFSKDVELAQVVARFYPQNELFTSLVNFAKLYFAPSRNELEALIKHRRSYAPKAAFELAVKLTQGSDYSLVTLALEPLLKDPTASPIQTISPLKEKNRDLYYYCYSLYMAHLVQKLNFQDDPEGVSLLFALLCELQGTKYQLDILKKILDNTFATPVAAHILAIPDDAFSRYALFCHYLHSVLPEEKSVAEVAAQKAPIMQLVDRFQSSEVGQMCQKAYALCFIRAMQNPRIPQEFWQVVDLIKTRKVRRELFAETAAYLCKKYSPEVLYPLVTDALAKLPDAKERSKFLQFTAIFLAQKAKPEEVKKILELIVDPFTRDHCQKVIESLASSESRSSGDEPAGLFLGMMLRGIMGGGRASPLGFLLNLAV